MSVPIIDGAINAARAGTFDFVEFAESTLEEAAIAALFEEAAADAVAAGVAASTIALVLVVVLLVICVVSVVVHVWLQDQVKGLPLVGGGLDAACNWVSDRLQDLATPIWNMLHAVLVNLWNATEALVHIAVAPLLDPITYELSQVTGITLNLDQLGIGQQLGDVQGEINRLYQWEVAANAAINGLQSQVNTLRSQLTETQAEFAQYRADQGHANQQFLQWLQQAEVHEANDVAETNHAISDLWQNIDTNRAMIRDLQAQTAQQSQSIGTIDTTLYAPLTGLAPLLTLLPLASLIPDAVDSLRKTALDPCRCLNVGGGFDWVPVAATLALGQS